MSKFHRCFLLVVVLLQQAAALAQSPAPVPAAEPKAKSLPAPTVEEKAEMERLRDSARQLAKTKKYAAAEKEYRVLVALKQRVLGEEHPDTLTSRLPVAYMLEHQGRFDEAEKELRAVLKTREAVLGLEHVHVSSSCLALAWHLQHQKKLLEALEFVKRAEAGYRQSLGDEEEPTFCAVKLRKNIETELKKQSVK